MATLRLGNVDADSMPANPRKYLDNYHPFMPDSMRRKTKFRDERTGLWRSFIEREGGQVKELQRFLKDAGFMPKAAMGGIYGYETMAAVRLFQHYMLTVEKETSIGSPDGVAGKKTFKFIEKWKAEGKGICKWGQSSAANPLSEHFNQWMDVLRRAKDFYSTNENPILKFSEEYTGKTATRKVSDWDVDPNSIHLVGIRRGEDDSKANRTNNDLFALLINGMVFYFLGSADPNSKRSYSLGNAFLMEGQHEYVFGWHKISDATKVYRALRPASRGVLIFRDKDGDKILTDKDFENGVFINDHINIHWTGIGNSNYSAGCQVIAGRNYWNEKEFVDCSKFAASGYADLGSKTRGAYDLLTDLILTYAAPGVTSISYTLARDEALFLADGISKDMLDDVVSRMQSGK